MPLEAQSMGSSANEEHHPPSKAELDTISRGSMVKVIDPERSVWYWVIIERRLKDHHYLQGRIDAYCVLGPTLRHGGTVIFHEDNVLYLYPRKVSPMFDATWFRVLSHLLSLGKSIKALKHATSN
jgi:hypothetical protein